MIARSSWTEQDAAVVLLEQKKSGRGVMDFAVLHGFPGRRLYYWGKRWPRSPAEVPERPDTRVQPKPLAPMTPVEAELELAQEALL